VTVYGSLRTQTLSRPCAEHGLIRLTTDFTVPNALSSAPITNYSMIDAWRSLPISDCSDPASRTHVLLADCSVLNTLEFCIELILQCAQYLSLRTEA